MYADRMEGGARRPVKERLNNGNGVIGSTRQQQQRQITGKRSRQDDKWEHDLFDNDKPQITNCKVSAPDLRLKLQRKGLQLAAQSGKSSAPNMRDLHERLSGTMSPQLTNADQPKTKVVKSSSKSVGVEAPAVQIKRPADLTPKKSQKAGSSVDEFLRSLCLEKYLITFQAEEVDMTALNHMTDEDLKAMGIPMLGSFEWRVTVTFLRVSLRISSCFRIRLGIWLPYDLEHIDSESLSIEEIAVQVSDFWLDEMKDDKLLVDNLQVSISEVPALDIPLMSLKRKRVREIISIASLTIVKLQETKLESFDALQDIRDLRFKDYGFSFLGCQRMRELVLDFSLWASFSIFVLFWD
ncbi:hypothetical protein JHK87_044804 [Glycine soja]|nr:hypothetical protein JHK87_044804 [Glycine soja]